MATVEVGTTPVGWLSPWRIRFNLWHHVLLLVVLLSVATPLIFLILGSLSPGGSLAEFALDELSLDNYEDVWLDPITYSVITNTVIYVVGTTIFGMSMALALAFLVERTNIPGKIWIYAMIPMTLAVPSMLQAMAWVLLLSPRIGFINTYLGYIGLGPINIYSLGGMIFLEGLRVVPTAFLMLVPLLRGMDPALEEAAAMSGAKPSRVMRKVTFRLLLPGFVAVVIYQAITVLTVFEIPGILGLPSRIYVFSTLIYSYLSAAGGTPNYGQANALSMIYLVIAVVAIVFYSRIIARSERFAVITGKGYRPRVIDLGRWRYAAVIGVFLYILCEMLLPMMVFVYVSFLPYVQAPSLAAFATMTLSNYAKVLSSDMIGIVLWNTVILTAATSTAVVIFSLAIATVVVRSDFWGRRLLDQLAFVPHAIPGIVLGMAFFWMFLQIDKTGLPIAGGVLAMTIAFTIGFLSYGTRAMNAALIQIHKELEEAAYTSGAARWRTIFRVVLPLMMPACVGLWVWVMLHVVRQAGKPLILYEGKENQVLAILIWNMWDEGYMESVAAIGTLLMLVLMIITLLLRFLGFGRGAKMQM